MFTGIVQAIGRVARVTPVGKSSRLGVDARTLSLDDVGIGDSIAVNGCCLTVVNMHTTVLDFDVSAETLAHVVGLREGAEVNLEKALRLADRLGGHLLQGHVDGVGDVVAFGAVGDDEGRNWRLEVDAPAAIAHFIAAKGSIAVDGVSLTVNGVQGARFHVNLIPHTLAVTTLRTLKAGLRVNLEVDMMARYAARLLDAEGELHGT